MPTHQATLIRDGRITIPVAIRRALHLVAGELLTVERQGDTIRVRRAHSAAKRTAGILSKYRHAEPLASGAARVAFERAAAEDVADSLPT